MKRNPYEAVSGEAEKYEALAREAGASDVHELADLFRRLRVENRRRGEKAGRRPARRVAE